MNIAHFAKSDLIGLSHEMPEKKGSDSFSDGSDRLACIGHVLRQLVDVVHWLHCHQIAHLSVSPANIVVTGRIVPFVCLHTVL